ncbi:MAG: carboxypeptidase-like regulatory domain-containing protein [Myxococcota bacterium]|nr:carboxypeptidase-like regulatory domain-containing protein [Myxococcota bacterium]
MLALLLTLACASDTPLESDSAVEADADTDADSDTDTDADTDADADTDVQVALTGVITDLDGDPLTGARVQLCQESCWFAETDATGAYTFGDLPVQTYAWEVVPVGEDWPVALAPLTLSEGLSVDLAMPRLNTGAAMPETPTEVSPTPGLWLTISGGELTLPFGADGSMVRGAPIPLEHLPPTEGVSGTIVGGWYLTPFDAHHDAGGVPFRVDAARLGIGDGTQVEVWFSRYLEADWVRLGPFTVQDGRLEGTGLSVLSTLLITTP